MLEYLLFYIEQNILLIFLCVLALVISSTYSKIIKSIFIFTLVCSFIYFIFLCLYRLGIGIDILYCFSSKLIISFLEHIKCYSVLGINHFIAIEHLTECVFGQHIANKFTIIVCGITTIIILPFILSINKPIELDIKINKLKFNINKHNNLIKKIIVDNKTANKFLNCTLRC